MGQKPERASNVNPRPDKIPKIAWVYITVVLFMMLFTGVIAFILGAGRLTLPNGLYYPILVLLGLGAAAFLFGAMRSYAIYKGRVPYGNLELGGPVALVALVVVGGLYANRASTFSLTVRVHGPGGAAEVIREGRLIADLEGVRRNQEIGTDGEVVFADVPAALDGQRVQLIPEVPGYDPPSSAPTLIPPSHIIELGLVRKTFAIPMRGTVRDGSGRQVEKATLSFDGGTVTAVSDAQGHFRVVIPLAPGKVIPITVTINGELVYNESLTVSAEPALDILIRRASP